jgi:hypothetical protein
MPSSSTLPIPIGNRPASFSSETEYNNNAKPGFNLLRRGESGFSIASLAASLPIGGGNRARSTGEEEKGQQLVTVSRPSSLKSKTSLRNRRRDGDESQDDEDDDDDDDDDESAESAATGDDDEEESDDDEAAAAVETVSSSLASDARSIRSFETMLSAGKEQGKSNNNKKTVRPRKSISDRLASVSAVAAASKVRVFGLYRGDRNLITYFFFGGGVTDISCWFTKIFSAPSKCCSGSTQPTSGSFIAPPYTIIINITVAAAFGTTEEAVY